VSPTGRLRGFAAGAAAGLAGGTFGVGGGVVLVPTLAGVFRLTQHQAHGTSLAVVAATALPAVIVYATRGNVAWTTAALVAVASMVTARYGARLATRLSGRSLKRAFAVFLFLVALRLLWKPPTGAALWPAAGTVASLLFEFATGALIGLLAGFMGVGGGIIAVPAFTLGLGMPQHIAQGTSLAVILVTGPAGAIEHARHGNVIGRVAVPLAIGAALGSPAGSWLANHLKNDLLVRCFAAFLTVNAVLTWIRAGRAAATDSEAPASAARR
jgi:uncharacterized membrane protein YfcA